MKDTNQKEKNSRSFSSQTAIVGVIALLVGFILGSLFPFSFMHGFGMHYNMMDHDEHHMYMHGEEHWDEEDMPMMQDGEDVSLMNEERLAFIDQKTEIQTALIHQGDYACCLATPCTYCIEKTPEHGEEASCHCLDDVMNGRHPCGECIGEILEGHGNPFIAKYFSKAIAEEVGEQHLPTLKQIIAEKYDITVGEQV